MLNGAAREAARVRGQELLERLGLAKLASRYPDQLSGGEIQRVAVARATATGPKLLLADEPTGALDSTSGAEVMRLLLETSGQNQDSALVVVTHNREVAALADRVVQMRDGQVVELTPARGGSSE